MAEPREADPRLDAAIDEALSDLATAEPSREFRARVMARLQTPAGHTLAWTLAAAGAVTGLMAVLVLRPSEAPRGENRPGQAALPPSLPAPVSPPAATPSSSETRRGPRPVRRIPAASQSPSEVAAAAIGLPPVELEPLAPPAPLPKTPPLVVARVEPEPIPVEPLSVDGPAEGPSQEERP